MSQRNFMEAGMFILIFILVLFLPGALLPGAIKTFFSSEELLEMGVSLEDSQPGEVYPDDQVNSPKTSPLCPCAGLST